MEQLINIRQHIIGYYKKFEIAVNYILKFFIGLFIFSRINSLGLYREDFEVLFGSAAEVSYLALVSLIFTISPPSIALLLITIAITIQLSAVLEVAFFVFLLLVLLIVFYARLAPRQSMLILAMVFGFYFNMPYAVVLFAGLYFGVTSMIPVVLGTAVWYFLPFFTNLAQTVETVQEFDLVEIPIAFMEVFAQIFSQLTTDFNWIVIGFVFAMVVLAVHLISRISINFSSDIAIGVGALISIICMSMVVMVVEVENMTIGGIFISAIFSALLVWIAKFFEGVRDYKRVERVSFDDEDNYYYVKIVPKITAESGEAPAKPPAPEKTPKPTRPARRPQSAPASAPTPTRPATARPAADEYGYRSKLINSSILDEESE